eukprot:Skav231629  [mRNA]  locus=scaffold1135:89083:89871:+ [translate_table: standard]
MARAPLSKLLLAAGLVMALRLLSADETSFVTPQQRNEAAAAMAAAMVAASSGPAMAEAKMKPTSGDGRCEGIEEIL